MADLFDQLKQKYQPVLDTIQREGAELQNLNLDGNQLYLKATAVSEASKDRIWDSIKAVDPNFTDLKHDIQFRQAVKPIRCRLATTYQRSASASTETRISILRLSRQTILTIQTKSRWDSNSLFPRRKQAPGRAAPAAARCFR
jgi:hypothetical protein